MTEQIEGECPKCKSKDWNTVFEHGREEYQFCLTCDYHKHLKKRGDTNV